MPIYKRIKTKPSVSDLKQKKKKRKKKLIAHI